MPLPRWLARVNLKVTNRLTMIVAAWLPWFCVLEHVGRASGMVRRTPLNVFVRGDRYVIALTYGADVQWLHNVVAVGRARILTRCRWVELAGPRVYRDPRRADMPWLVRPFLAMLRVDEFVEMRRLAESKLGAF